MSDWHALHFNKIAKMLREKREKAKQMRDTPFIRLGRMTLLNELTLEFAEYFNGQNKGFDPDKFIEACGYTKES